MNAAKLLKQFDRLSEAPEAVNRLRRFILDLAVRGKLVEQNAGDEPATALLKRIETERMRLVKAGKYKGVTKPAIILGEPPLNRLPKNWSWVPFGATINTHIGGGTPSKSNTKYWNGDIPWASVKDVGKDKFLDSTIDRITLEGLNNSSSNLIDPGHLIVVTRMGLGKVSINRIAVAINQDIRALVISSLVSIDYCYIYLKTHSFEGTGLTVKGIKIEELLGIAFPLPPLTEQYRIVAKVEELMVLCDELDAAQRERELRRDRLVATSLKYLNQPAVNSPLEALQEDVRFYLNHLFQLTTKPNHIRELRQTIFGLAVRGLLVAQDRTEEPAEAVLKTIRQEKAQLVKAGTIPREKTVPEKALSPFPLPANWQAVRLGEVCNFVTSGSRGWAAFYAENGPKFLRAQNIRFGRLRLDDVACVNPPIKTEGQRTQVQIGDLLIVITGAGVANPALLECDLGEAYVSQHVALVRPTNSALSKWLLLCLMSGPGGRNELVERAYGAGKPGLNLDNIRSLNTPIPPLAEQHRIVAKVEELIALCDQIETLLSSIQTDSNALLENLLDKTLAIVRPSSKLNPVATVPAMLSRLQKVGKESPFMTTSPANNVDQLLDCIDDLGGATTPERLLMQTGLSEDVEVFYDLIRAARDSGKLTAPLGAGEEIRRLVDAD